MPVREDIIQNLILAGEEDVIKGLYAVGEAGTTAFKAIARASTATSFEHIFEGITGVASAAAIATAGMARWADVSARSVLQLERLSGVSGASIDKIGTLSTALTRVSGDTDNLSARMRVLAQRIEEDWGNIQHNWRTATDEQIRDNERIVLAKIAAEKATIDLSNVGIEQDLKRKQVVLDVAKSAQEASATQAKVAIEQKQNAVTITGAYLKMVDAEAQLADYRANPRKYTPDNARELQRAGYDPQRIARMKIENQLEEAQTQYEAATVKAKIDKAQAILNLQQTELNYYSSIQKARKEAQYEPYEEIEKKSKAIIAQTEARLAATKAEEDEGNAIQNLKKYFDDLAKGADVSGQKIQFTSQNISRGMIASVGAGGVALEGFNGNLGMMGLQAPKLIDVMYKVADVFKHTEDQTLKMALAVSLFGRGVSQQLVAALSQGSEALKGEQERLHKLGLEFTDADATVTNTFMRSLTRLSTAIQIVGTQFGLKFAPMFGSVMEQVATLIENNREKILGWAEDVVNYLQPAFAGFFEFLTGTDISERLGLSEEAKESAAQWKQTFEGFKKSAGEAFDWIKERAGFVSEMFKGLSDGVEYVAKKLSEWTGKKIDPADLGLTLLIGQLTGVNNMIVLTIGYITLLTAALLGIPATIALIAAAFTVLNWDSIKKGIGDAWDWLNEKAAKLFKTLNPIGGAIAAETSNTAAKPEGESGFKKILEDTDKEKAKVDELNKQLEESKKRAAEIQFDPAKTEIPVGKIAREVDKLNTSLEKTQRYAKTVSVNDITSKVDPQIKSAEDFFKAADKLNEAKRDVTVRRGGRQGNLQGTDTSWAGNLGPGEVRIRQPGKGSSEMETRKVTGLHVDESGSEGIDKITKSYRNMNIDTSGHAESEKILQAAEDRYNKMVEAKRAAEQAAKQAAEVPLGAASTNAMNIAQAGIAALDALKRKADEVSATLGRFDLKGPTSQSSSTSTQSTAGFAEGGEVSGPSGIDAVNARLTDGEFVHKTSAVNFWGLDFMHAINNMQMPRFLGLPRYAEGGLHGSASMARSAAGIGAMSGSGSGMSDRSFTLNLGQGKVFSGLTGAKATIDALHREAMLSSLANASSPSGNWR